MGTSPARWMIWDDLGGPISRHLHFLSIFQEWCVNDSNDHFQTPIYGFRRNHWIQSYSDLDLDPFCWNSTISVFWQPSNHMSDSIPNAIKKTCYILSKRKRPSSEMVYVASFMPWIFHLQRDRHGSTIPGVTEASCDRCSVVCSVFKCSKTQKCWCTRKIHQISIYIDRFTKDLQ